MSKSIAVLTPMTKLMMLLLDPDELRVICDPSKPGKRVIHQLEVEHCQIKLGMAINTDDTGTNAEELVPLAYEAAIEIISMKHGWSEQDPFYYPDEYPGYWNLLNLLNDEPTRLLAKTVAEYQRYHRPRMYRVR